MNGAGLFLAVTGVWVLSQVLAGDALQRLGIFARSAGGSPGLPDLPNPFGFLHPPKAGVGGHGSTPDPPPPGQGIPGAPPPPGGLA